MRYIILFFLFFISIDCFSQQGVFKTNVVVDGDLSEWGEKLDHYDKENMLWYSVANDDEFLYLAILKDKHARKAISLGKVQIYIAESKISELTQSIIYPVTLKTPFVINGRHGFKTENSWDLLVVNNSSDKKRDTLSVFNEMGIQAQGRIEETEEAKEERRRIMASLGQGMVGPVNLPALSKGVTAYLEFAIPLKQLEIESGNLNIKINLKGNSEEGTASDMLGYLKGVAAGPRKDEQLDDMVATEYSFIYKLAKKK